MNITESVRQPRAFLSREIKILRIAGLKPEDAKELFNTLCFAHSNYGRETSFEVYIRGDKDNFPEGNVSGGGFVADDFWKDVESKEHFLAGYDLAMLMNGVDVQK